MAEGAAALMRLKKEAAMPEFDLDELSAELEEFAPGRESSRAGHTREERIIAGFEEIQRFVETHGRAPQHGEDRDIFERLYAVVSIGCERLTNVVRCWSLWIIRG